MVVAVSGTLLAAPSSSAWALDASEFNAGNIISDANFYDGNALTEAEIQAFLNAKVGSCENSYCLAVYKETTTSRAKDRTVCDAYVGAPNESAARIIFKVQQACGISAKVILVTLNRPDFRSVLQVRMEHDEQEVFAGDA